MKTTDAARADHPARWDNGARGKQTGAGIDSARGFEAHGQSEGRGRGRGLDPPGPADAPVLELPWDHGRAQRPGSRTAAHPFSLGNALTARLVKLAAHERVTLATALVASVAALLHRYTGEDQVCLGLSGVADQGSGAGATLEPLRRDLVLCADVAGQPSVGELLQRTRKGIEAGLDRDARRCRHLRRARRRDRRAILTVTSRQ